MSSCNEYVEFACRMTLETGAPPHHLLPILRKLRRLATTHQRRCVIACNGCPRCDGYSPERGGWVPPTHPTESEEERDRCPVHGTDSIEQRIAEECMQLGAYRSQSRSEGRGLSNWGPFGPGDCFRPVFSHDPRGATVKIQLPSGIHNTIGQDGYAVPTSGRA